MKIYTKGGDSGETSLASGRRVWKHNIRVALYGEADELNSQLGLAISLLPENLSSLGEELQGLQSLLFELASELADWQGLAEGDAIGAQDITGLENAIDRMQKELPELKSFVLPGGHAAASALHVARTCCRRLERSLVSAQNSKQEDIQENTKESISKKITPSEENSMQGAPNLLVRPAILKYINRLSDYLFVAARYINFQSGHAETVWKSRSR